MSSCMENDYCTISILHNMLNLISEVLMQYFLTFTACNSIIGEAFIFISCLFLESKNKRCILVDESPDHFMNGNNSISFQLDKFADKN